MKWIFFHFNKAHFLNGSNPFNNMPFSILYASNQYLEKKRNEQRNNLLATYFINTTY